MDEVDSSEIHKLAGRLSTPDHYITEQSSSAPPSLSPSQQSGILAARRYGKLYGSRSPQGNVPVSDCSSSEKLSPPVDFTPTWLPSYQLSTLENASTTSVSMVPRNPTYQGKRTRDFAQSLEQKSKMRKCQQTHPVADQYFHGLWEMSENGQERAASDVSDGTPSGDAGMRFLNDTLHQHLNTFMKKIHSPVITKCLQVLKEYDVDLDYVIKRRERGDCMKKFEELLDICIQRVVMSANGSDTDHVSDEGRSSDNFLGMQHEVPQREHTFQQTSAQLPQHTQEERDTSVSWVKQEPLGDDAFQEAEKQETSSDTDSSGENGEHVTTNGGMLNKKARYGKHIAQDEFIISQGLTMAVPSAEMDSRNTAGQPLCPKRENVSLTHEDEKTRDKSELSSPGCTFYHPAESEPAMDMSEEFRDDLDRRTSDGEHAGDDPEQEMEEGKGEVGSPEDQDTVQMTQDGVTLKLLRASIWRNFSAVGTEMIINRSGRRMFPFVSIRLRGLEEMKLYEVTMEVVPADAHRYKFISNVWTAVGVADTPTFNHPYQHPESPNSGRHWMSREIHFTRIKLTNNKGSSEGNMLLNSMHKYVVEITIRQLADPYNLGKMARSFRFRLDLTSFIAVTAYQNDLVTKLKIHNNPFAKAFRDSNLPASGGLGGGRGLARKGGDSKPWDLPGVGRRPQEDPLAMAARSASLLDPGAVASMTAAYYSSRGAQSDDHRMVLPPRPHPMLWVPGVTAPWPRVDSQGMIHPCLYNLPRPDGTDAWDSNKPF